MLVLDFFDKILCLCEKIEADVGNTFEIGFRFLTTENYMTINQYYLLEDQQKIDLVKSILMYSNSNKHFEYLKIFIECKANSFSTLEKFYHIDINDDMKSKLEIFLRQTLSGVI